MDMSYTGWVPEGNDVIEFKVIDPPDDRYIPGYSIVEADGDKKTVGPRLKDLNIPFSLYGLPIPITFGVRRLYGNILWAIPLRENIKKTKSGGSGGPTEKTSEYQYFATYAVSFGVPGNTDATKRDVLRVWADGSLIYDRRGTGQVKIQGFNFDFYPADPAQLPDPTMEAKMGVGMVPAFRDFMYMVIKDLPVAMWGNRPPSISVEIGDATSATYTVTNIYPSADVAGSRSQSFGFADWNRMLYYSVRPDGSNTQDTVRTYSMADGTLVNTAYLNSGDGVGWDNNSNQTTEDDLAHILGVQSTSVGDYGMTYIPWLNVIVGMPQGGLGRGPIALMDPLTGVPVNWVGSKIFGTGAHAYPANTLTVTSDIEHFQGYINYPKFYSAQLVYGQYSVDTYIYCQSFYTGTGIAVLHLSGDTGWLDIGFIESGVNYDSFCPGTVGYGYSDMMIVDENYIYRHRIKTGAGRTKSGASNIITGFTKSLWKDCGSGINNVYYHAYEDVYIVFLDNGTCNKYDPEGDLIATVSAVGKLPPAHDHFNFLHDMSNGYLAWQTVSDGSTHELDITFMTITTFTDTSTRYAVDNSTRMFSSKMRMFAGIGTSGAGVNGTGQSDSMDDALSLFYYDRLGDARMPLADFLTGMALYAGYLISEIYVDPEIDDEIDGAVISQITSYRAVINACSAIYRIDVIESDGQVKFLRKPVGYSSTDFQVADGETLLPSNNTPDGATFTSRREEEIAVPQRVLLRYLDKNLSYNWSMQFATRSQFIQTNGSNEQITYEVPIAMTAVEAKTLANRALWTAWSSRVSYDFRLPQKFFKVEPGDVGSVIIGPLTYTVKAAEVTYNNDFSIGIRGTSFQSDEAVEFNADAGNGYNQQIPFDLGGDLYILDIPLLKSNHDLAYTNQFTLYLHLSPILKTTAWLGASAYLSILTTPFYEAVANTNEGCVAVALTIPTVPDSLLQTDTVNSFNVVVKAGDETLLASCTESDMLDGANLAAYGANGRWELIQFMTVTENADGSYTLSNLVRARNGTDFAVDGHKIGDTLILIGELFTDLTPLSITQVESSLRYKAVGPTQSEAAINSKTVALHGYAALPWVPTVPTITRSIDDLTGDIEISWDRRGRNILHLQDGTDAVALPTNDEDNYLVTIYRWPYYTWAFSSGLWRPTLVEGTAVEFEVTGATSLTLTLAEIRTAELYEFEVPDNLSSSGSTFTAQAGDYIAANADENELVADIGYSEFASFKYLDVMVQQATSLATASGYGPGRITRVTIQDT
jgi:hypothetical protein